MRKERNAYADGVLVAGILLKPLFGSRPRSEREREFGAMSKRGRGERDLRARSVSRGAKISRQVSNKEADLHISMAEDERAREDVECISGV